MTAQEQGFTSGLPDGESASDRFALKKMSRFSSGRTLGQTKFKMSCASSLSTVVPMVNSGYIAAIGIE